MELTSHYLDIHSLIVIFGKLALKTTIRMTLKIILMLNICKVGLPIEFDNICLAMKYFQGMENLNMKTQVASIVIIIIIKNVIVIIVFFKIIGIIIFMTIVNLLTTITCLDWY